MPVAEPVDFGTRDAQFYIYEANKETPARTYSSLYVGPDYLAVGPTA